VFEIVIVGAGGFGREVYLWARESFPTSAYRIKGFLAKSADELVDYSLPVGILGDEHTYAIQPQDVFLIALGDIDVKKRVTATLQARCATFLTLIHPKAIVAPTAHIGEGTVICPFALVSDHVEIGPFAALNFYASCGHDAKVGTYSILSPYATVGGFAVLENEVYLGPHATVIHRRRVGYRSKISANSTAMSDIPPYTLVYGVPGRQQVIFAE
jgi:sugar O-acyltransferase (sialic acid O-acetyltransferase NeuD family)